VTLTEDERRVAGIAAYGALDDAVPAGLADVVELAAGICGVPMATINIITDREQHQIAAVGFEPSICRREDSMCAAILHEDPPVVVADASLDPRFLGNPFVTGEVGAVRFYAAHRLVTQEGVVIGTLCVFDDQVRELDEAQARALGTLAGRIVDVFELRVAQRRLERSNDRLAAFAGQVTHDLKTPLTTMSLSLELIRDELEDGAEAADLVPLISRALGGSRRMTTMIEDVLAFARMGTTIDPLPVDLDKVAADVAADLASRMDGVTLVLEDLPTVPGDEGQLRMLLQNLVANAIKFRAEDRPPVVTVSAGRVGDRWRVEVTDNGIGVPEDQRERIFEPMVRLDKRIDGVGIGLATSKRVADSHGGTIGASANPSGDGSVFWVELPA
jgi:signal transduction histidine kinase